MRERAEGQVVAPEHPHDERDREAREDHQHRVDDPLLANEPAVENGESGKLIKPTNVAAVSCHVLSAGFSQWG